MHFRFNSECAMEKWKQNKTNRIITYGILQNAVVLLSALNVCKRNAEWARSYEVVHPVCYSKYQLTFNFAFFFGFVAYIRSANKLPWQQNEMRKCAFCIERRGIPAIT